MASSLSVTVSDREAATVAGWSKKDYQKGVIQSEQSATVAHWTNREGVALIYPSLQYQAVADGQAGSVSGWSKQAIQEERKNLLVSKSRNQSANVAG